MNRIFFYLKRFLLTAIFLTIGVIVFSQLNGDYRSKQNGFWHDPASWEKFNGTTWVNAPTAPTSSDGPISILNGHTITTSSIGGDITADQVTLNAGAVLTLNSTLNLADGAGNDLTVNGTIDFNGNLNGPGNIVISAAGTINFPAFFDVFLGASLTNNGKMNRQGNGRIWAMSNMTITNNGTFTITSNSSTLDNAGIQSSFVNNGNITKNSGGQTEFRNTNFTNAGTINLNAGTLQNFCAFSNTGILNFNGGIFLNSLGGITSFAFNAGSAISGTGSFINSAPMTLNVNVVFPATVLFNTGSHTSIITGTGNLTINNDFTMQGLVDGSGSLIINGNVVWNSGTLGRAFTVDAGRTMTITTADVKIVAAAVINNGTINWQDGHISFSSPTTVTNNNLFIINSNSNLAQNGPLLGSLINNGVITKSSVGLTVIMLTNVTNNANAIIKGIGTMGLNFPTAFTNNGIIEPGLSPGILTMNGANAFGANSTLNIEIAGNGGAGQLTGHDQFQRAGDLALNGNLTVIETGTVPDGDYTIISLTSGVISGTFSSANLPANYSVIYNSNNVVVRKGTICPPSVTINAIPGNTICSGTNVTFTATPTNGGSPGYQWKVNGNNVGTNSDTYSNSALANGDIVTVVMTSSLGCANPNTATSNGITMAVTPAVVPSVSISPNPGNTICSGTNVTFTAIPTNGGTPSYQWKLNGNNVGTNSFTYSNNTLVNGDIVTVVITSSLECASPATATSNGITMAVNGNVAPSVSIVASPTNTICSGTNVTFTAIPTNGGSPSYQWKLNGNNVGTNSNTYQNASLVNGDVVTVVMTSTLACAIPSAATSNAIIMTVNPAVTPSVSIAASPTNTICSGTNVTFTATPTNGGAPSYQWKLNGNNVGTNSNTYQNASLVNGDVVTVVMTSTLACAIPSAATSNAIIMTVNPAVTPSVSIAANPGNTICTGTNVTFTATPTNGGAPSYQWKLNGNDVGTNSSTYQNASLVNGDVVTVTITSSLACANPTTATSPGITMVVTATVTPSVSISANPGNTICTGANVTFTATPINGGSPSYQWKLNGNNVGANSNTYQNSTLVNGDVVTVVMTSSLACASPATATSSGITMVVTATVTPSVSIIASPGNTICAGTNVLFTATPTNGGTPSYQWKLNGNNVGTNSNTYQNASLANGDVVTVVMTSSLACASPATATSNAITMTVDPSIAPSVSIAANPGNIICTGTNVTFTATPTNGGTPSYQWKLNGNNVGTNSNTYSNTALVNVDVVTVLMTSSLGCASPATATSNAITMIVSGNVAPSVSVVANPGSTICTGTNVIFTATPTNGGTPSYQWKLNGNNVGTNSNTYQNASLINGDVVTVVMTSSLACASPATATSNAITMTISGNVSPSVSISASPGNTICSGTNVTFTATPTNGGVASYQWTLNGNNVGSNSNTYQNSSLVNGDVVTVVMTSSLACASPTTATSNGITMVVTPTVTPSVTIAANPGNTICGGTNVTFTATPTHGGTPSYQWKLNGNNVGTNSNTYQNASLVNGNVISVVMTSTATCASPTAATSNAITMTVLTRSTFYIDADGDGFGSAAFSQQACSAPNGYVTNNSDCDDNNTAVHPGAAEVCGNGIDDNCNDQTDENCTADLPTLITRTYPVKEGDAGSIVFDLEVKLDRPAPLQVRINYATFNDDALAGLDYAATQGVLTIPVGATSGIVRVSIIGDRLRENNERFWLNFSNPVNVIIDGDRRSRIMIIDDDKGRPNVRADNEMEKEQLPHMIIPTVVSRNHIWAITGISELSNEVTIMNLQGQVIFRANNYKNNIPVGNASIGVYVYQIRVMEKDKKVKFYTGKLLVTE